MNMIHADQLLRAGCGHGTQPPVSDFTGCTRRRNAAAQFCERPETERRPTSRSVAIGKWRDKFAAMQLAEVY
jgi:hypothetical protein